MIGVCYPDTYAVEETFHLLKIPWEWYEAGRSYALIIGDARDLPMGHIPIIDLADRDYFALVRDGLNRIAPGRRDPDVDLVVDDLRKRIIHATLLVEIPPAPWGHPYMVALSHDVDITSVQERPWLSVGYAAFDRIRNGEIGYGCKILAAKCGLSSDPWDNIDIWSEAESARGIRSTFFFLPRPHDAGANAPSIRAGNYHLDKELILDLVAGGWEVGVHGIDNWHDQRLSEEELCSIACLSGGPVGNRVHWLLFDPGSSVILETAGYRYDSTVGYNNEIGYPSGTLQAYCPKGLTRMLELPVHIQDLALLGKNCWAPSSTGWTRLPCMALSPGSAFEVCLAIFEQARRIGGCVTLLWHNVSGGSFEERFDLYLRLIDQAQNDRAYLGPIASCIDWFEQRRRLHLTVGQTPTELHIRIDGLDPDRDHPAFRLRIHLPQDRVQVDGITWVACDGFIDLLCDRTEIVVTLI